jgi:protein-S-isoprenylcysteine O-methyltransferase Ste14
MALREEMEKQGNWLFRWRSYVPLLFIPVLLLALPQAAYFERQAGAWAADCWAALCLVISFAGLGVRIVTIGYAPRRTSGRNTREQKAETLNTTGMYSLVRHPLYVGNCLMILGVAGAAEVWWFAGLVIIALWLYYERIIMAEESFLKKKFGVAYEVYTRFTPAFLPKLSLWKKTALSYSVKFMIRKECHGLFVMILIFSILGMACDGVAMKSFVVAHVWVWIAGISTLVYVLINLVTKKMLHDVR